MVSLRGKRYVAGGAFETRTNDNFNEYWAETESG
jgi:hypothetical protein